MSGISSANALALEEYDHIRQSIQDLLLTQLGERVMRRDYGTWIRYLVDAPMDPVTIMDIYSAVVGAIRRWEPRVLVRQVEAAELHETGQIVLHITATHAVTGEPIHLANMRFM